MMVVEGKASVAKSGLFRLVHIFGLFLSFSQPDSREMRETGQIKFNKIR
ncbi:MAG: hypothetical protein QOE37_2307 [Microbacteriaceae bacterium]|jgi:hypothetical protein|nr:hypothetical protein [Microbacteriaceae bacterium]